LPLQLQAHSDELLIAVLARNCS